MPSAFNRPNNSMASKAGTFKGKPKAMPKMGAKEEKGEKGKKGC